MRDERLKGEIILLDRKVRFAVPPIGWEGATQFEVIDEHPTGPTVPAWMDILLDGKLVRINPALCQPPFNHLANCLMFAHLEWSKLPCYPTVAKVTLPPAPHPNALVYLIVRISCSNKQEYVLIETMERYENYTAIRHASLVQDGQTSTTARVC